MKNKILVAIIAAAVGFALYTYKDMILEFIGMGNSQSGYVDNVGEIPIPIQETQTPPNTAQSDMQGDVNLQGPIEPGPNASAPIQILATSCNGGNFDDCVALSNLYLENKGKEDINAVKALIIPCEKKHAKSCEILSEIYDQGLGVKPSVNIYAGYAIKACDFGSIEACYKLGVAYYRGKGKKGSGDNIHQDNVKAFHLFRKACDAGKIEGCNNLAVIYNNGERGIQKDTKRARTIFQNACNQGYKPSCDNLKRM